MEDSPAATKIAAFYRGEKVRKEVQKIKKATLSVQRIWRGRHKDHESHGHPLQSRNGAQKQRCLDKVDDDHHSRAATKIAAVYRGVKVRSTVNELKKATLSVQRMWRQRKRELLKEDGPKDDELLDLLLKYVELQNQQSGAAARIQRWFRQRQATATAESDLEISGERDEIRVLLEEHGALSAAKSSAASKIQRLFRNRRAWKKSERGNCDEEICGEGGATGDEDEEKIDMLYRLHRQLKEEDVIELAVLQQECLGENVHVDIKTLVTQSLSQAATSIQRAFRRQKKRRVDTLPTERLDSAANDNSSTGMTSTTERKVGSAGVCFSTSTDADTTTDSDSGCDCACLGTVCPHLWAAIKIQTTYRDLKKKKGFPQASALSSTALSPNVQVTTLFSAALLVQAGVRARQDRDRFLRLRKSVLRLQKQLRRHSDATRGAAEEWEKKGLSGLEGCACGDATGSVVVSEERRLQLRTRPKIYLLPLCVVPGDRSRLSPNEANLDLLAMFATLFFFRRTVVLPVAEISAVGLRTREHPSQGHRQTCGGDLLGIVGRNVPHDALGVVAITSEDLYLHESAAVSHVVGLASCSLGVGACSWARFDPAFYSLERSVQQRPLFFRRGAMVVTHEMCHMFGMGHCTRECLMRVSTNMLEADNRPLHLCPPCLTQLRSLVSFDEAVRAAELRLFFQSIGFFEEAQWLQKSSP